MKLGTEDKKKLYLVSGVGAVALLCLYPLYNELFGGPSGPPPVTAPVIKDVTPAGSSSSSTVAPGKAVSAPPGFAVGGKIAQKVGTGGGQLDPTLHMEAMHITEALVYTGTGRNIFAAGPSQMEIAAIAKAKAPARPIPVAIAAARPAEPTGPPPPPPIDLKFFGTSTAANGTRRALLLHGDDVFLASAGDVVQRRYRVVEIAAKSIIVEDIPNTNKQTLPLTN
ncbi:hypothetical protein [Granulicella tundricola]|uniref:Uncharacterized protein n=1 Tax=Granulicella tundricola (strain ATCC BAA-1859 / DSM 23138 / MP5ACTX9) TaxID=1198114 RepID=E8X284_GRATM|nr:hypothetical protein [Granulicella tundricola]ADW68016.1 hypothetical protein AciX9_0949 [Granulicella tundricola MP5ACTX9]